MSASRNLDATSHFDADAMAASQDAPTLTVGRYVYRGRLLSIEEWLPWWERFIELQRTAETSSRPAADMLKLLAFYRDYLRLVFPRRHYRWWAPDPVKHLLRQPLAVIEEAMTCFVLLQVRATFGANVVNNALRVSPAPSAPAPPGANS